MTLKEWVDAQGSKPHLVWQRLAVTSGVSYSTIRNRYHGVPIARFETAKKVSEATDGKVTVEDLCNQ